MKKVLFVLRAVRSGGSATSMLNLLELLKDSGLKCDLFLLQRKGIFLERAESVANVLPEERVLSSIYCPKENLREKGIIAFLIRTAFIVCHKIIGYEKAEEVFYRISARKLSNKYDTVVAYQESITTEYVRYIRANKRIAWIHNDYERFSINKSIAQQQALYDNYNELVCVSQASMDSMKRNLKISSEHIHLIYNTIPRDYIVSKSKLEAEELKRAEYVFLSMGRFHEQKGFDRAVRVAFRLKEEGIRFIWYILGDGSDFNKIQTKITDSDLENQMILLGVKENPFPYVRQADCFIMTSRYEAQPMVLNEALTLGIPVISTRFSSATEVVDDGNNGLIVDNSELGILQGVERFVYDGELRNRITSGAKKFVYNNDKIVNQVIELMSLR